MFERFSDRARHVLVLAQGEARLHNHGFIGSEHLLLALIREREGVAAIVLEHLGISLEAARDKVVEALGIPDGPPLGSPPFTPHGKKVLELALREAQLLRHTYIGTEHILLGLMREEEGGGAQVLLSFGMDLDRVREEVIEQASISEDETY